MRKIIVKIKAVYGQPKIYPVNDVAKIFAEIAGTSTLTHSTIAAAAKLGYTLETAPAYDLAEVMV